MLSWTQDGQPLAALCLGHRAAFADAHMAIDVAQDIQRKATEHELFVVFLVLDAVRHRTEEDGGAFDQVGMLPCGNAGALGRRSCLAAAPCRAFCASVKGCNPLLVGNAQKQRRLAGDRTCVTELILQHQVAHVPVRTRARC